MGNGWASWRQFLVHLDDPSADMQLEVFAVLCAMIRCSELFANTIAKKVKEVGASHRDPSLCNQLLKEVLIQQND